MSEDKVVFVVSTEKQRVFLRADHDQATMVVAWQPSSLLCWAYFLRIGVTVKNKLGFVVF